MSGAPMAARGFGAIGLGPVRVRAYYHNPPLHIGLGPVRFRVIIKAVYGEG